MPHFHRPAVALVLGLACAASAAPAAAVASGAPAGATRQIIVARTPGLAPAERGQLRRAAGVSHVRDLRLAHTETVSVAAARFDEALAELNADPGVRYAEPDRLLSAHSSDPGYSVSWALENTGQPVLGHPGTADADIDAPEAWARSTGAAQTVAVVDSGLDFAHEDLAGAFAVNPGESGGGKESNHVDDDHNGLIDDYRGWDFANDDNDPTDGDGHGTAVAGIIAARKDNQLGVAGVAPSAKVLVLRALGDSGTGSESDVASAFDLAGDLGIGQVNASLGGGGGIPQTLRAAIEAHPQTLYVVSAGNGGDDEVGDDVDVTPTYPCALPAANVVCVGATDSDDTLTDFSNFGADSVDLLAPGLSIASPAICSAACYGYFSGTSASSPHVAAVLALMRAANPSLGAAELKTRLLASVDAKPGLAGTSVTGGRLNAAGAVLAAGNTPADPCATVPPQPGCSPDGGTPPRAGGPAPVAVPVVPSGVRIGSTRPRLGKPSLSRSRLTRKRSAALRFTLDRAAVVRLIIRRGSHRPMRAITLRGKAGANRYRLRTRRGHAPLRRGRYRLTVVAFAGPLQSRVYTLRFRVR